MTCFSLLVSEKPRKFPIRTTKLNIGPLKLKPRENGKTLKCNV